MPNFIRVSFTLLILMSSVLANATEYVQHNEAFHSSILNEERTVVVQLPKSYLSNPNKVYPVIYRLDGAVNIPLISVMMEDLQDSGSSPEVIIVAIENTDRTRDLFPTVNNDPRGPVGAGGGGDKFLNFIEKELIPRINNKYRTHNFKIFSGASAGGVLVLHALHSRPNLFQAHIAYSPAVWWGEYETSKATQAIMSKEGKLDTYLYMNIGAEGGDMRKVYDQLHSFIQTNKPEKLKLVSDAFDGVPHGLTSAAGIFNAYHSLFLPVNMPLNAVTNGTKSVDNYYERLSAQRGEKVLPPEYVIREFGYYYVRQKNMAEAIAFFKYDIQLHPKNPDSYNGLAYGYETAGKLKEALIQVNLALELAEEDYPGYEVFTKRRDRLTSQLN